MKRTGLLLLLVALWVPATSPADQYSRVDELIAGTRPDGVVFEIIVWGDDSWDWAAPMLRQLTDRLRGRYPGLDVAVISHGHELFDLSRRANKQDTAPIRMLAQLSEEGVDLHICGRYARSKHLGVDDFLDFVDVADNGEAQLRDYIELGFEAIRLEAPDGFD